MITEDYVSFEIAKLLKEKGFDAEGVSEFGGFYVDYYHNGQRIGTATESEMLNKVLEDWEYLRPTLQMTMKWLREVHHKFICIDEHYYVKDIISHIADGFSYSFEVKHINSIYKQDGFTSYEQACEAAIKYCLKNLI